MYEGLIDWHMFLLLIYKTSEIAPGMIDLLLKEADAMDPETLELIVDMTIHLRACIRERNSK